MFKMLASHRAKLLEGAQDRGAALVTVIGIMMVGVVITTTLAVVTMYNTTQTIENRERLAALQSADAGIDITLDALEGLTYGDLAGGVGNPVCGGTYTFNNDTVEVKTFYSVSRGGSLLEVPCPSGTDITTSLRVESTATTTGLIPDGEPVVRTAVAELMPIPPEVMLDKAIFSEDATTITNDSELYESEPGANDAHVYSNNKVTCKTQVESGGSIYAAHGDVILENNCDIGNDVWAAGRVVMDSNTSISGDVYAASNHQRGIELKNSSSYIGGSALTNGGIHNAGRSSDSGGIDGTAFARTGGISLPDMGTIGDRAYANLDIEFFNGSSVGGDAMSFTGTIRAQNSNNTVSGNAYVNGAVNGNLSLPYGQVFNEGPHSVPMYAHGFPGPVGFPGQIQPPTREQMPVINMSEEDLNLWVGYNRVTVEECTGSDPEDYINGIDSSASQMIIFDCNNPVQFNNAKLTLKGNLALVSATGFRSQNELEIRGPGGGDNPHMHWIVPADSEGVDWNTLPNGQTTPSCSSPAGNIQVMKMQTWDVNLMWYTPCTVNWQNANSLSNGADPFIGQIYAGKVNLGPRTYIEMSQVPVPSLAESEPDINSPADMTLISRFDRSN